MGYRNLGECLRDLEAHGQLRRVTAEIDPRLEAGVIQRRACEAGGPAVLFENVRGTRFPMLCNLFGTLERARFLFRDTLRTVERMLAIKAEPMELLKRPWDLPRLGLAGLHTMAKRVRSGPVLECETTISALPHLVSWPMDGGAYVTLPQVYSESPVRPGFARSNLGMYRVQLTGGEYEPDREVGLHYQIHRGIGHHHAEAIRLGQPLKVNVFVGGPPAMTLAAVMPLPEGIAELLFAGAMGGRRVGMAPGPNGLPVLAEADFAICGTIVPGVEKPEGPFGDHLGYYSLAHDFPVLRVEKVLHRKDAVWPFTTVGRPPQEDTVFGAFIHELTEPMVSKVFAGVHEVHAVDAAGVHPLLLAVGSERYVPFASERTPQELLTCAMSLLGQTQTSLSKYVLLGAREDDPGLTAHDIPAFFRHLLERTDLRRDLHFITRTTMDTLDYSGISLNQGSKLVWAACGAPRRRLGSEAPALRLPQGFGGARVLAPGILLLNGPPHDKERDQADPRLEELARALAGQGLADPQCAFPLVCVVDDAPFTAAGWDNFLWVVFTRSDPATDIYGAGAFTHLKHWGAEEALVVDARLKTYHAPPLEADPDVERRVEDMAARGGPLEGLF
jgi:4-hydroxy-3-polyprenylbenzoate decarboxylase